MEDIPGFAELEAAKVVLLAALAQGVGKEQVIPGLQQLEEFRNSLSQADHLLIAEAKAHALPEHYAVSTAEKLVAQALRISYGDAKRRVRAAADCGPRTTMLGEELEPARPVVAAAQASGELSPWP